MTINQLIYFTSVCDNNFSMSKAAEINYVSQSTISVAVKELETEFKVKLFNRSTKHMELTDKGKKFYAYSKTILSTIDDLKKQFITIEAKPKINIGLSSKCQGVCTKYLNTEEGKQLFQDVNLYFMSSNELVDFLKRGVLDAAIITTSKLDFFPNINLKVLSQSYPVVYTNKDNPLSKLKTVTASDLEYEPMIVFMEYASNASNAIDNYNFFTSNLHLKNIVGYTTSIGVVLSMLKNNTASVIIGKGSICDEEIVMLDFKNNKPFDISGIWNKDSVLDDSIEGIFSIIKKIYDDMQ